MEVRLRQAIRIPVTTKMAIGNINIEKDILDWRNVEPIDDTRSSILRRYIVQKMHFISKNICLQVFGSESLFIDVKSLEQKSKNVSQRWYFLMEHPRSWERIQNSLGTSATTVSLSSYWTNLSDKELKRTSFWRVGAEGFSVLNGTKGPERIRHYGLSWVSVWEQQSST